MSEKVNEITNETAGSGIYIRPAFDRFRVVLLLPALIYTYGIYPSIDNFIRSIIGFAVPAFFIVSGYLVLREADDTGERILRTIKRTGLCFIILAAVYGLLSLIMFGRETITLLLSERFWIDFLFLNVWGLPVGSVIWYVQALLYAYIIIYILFKLRLLKLDWLFAVLCLGVTFVSGELSAFFDFEFLGKAYIGGNFLTRALPYIFIGSFIHRHIKKIKRMKVAWCVIIGMIAIVESIAEYQMIESHGSFKYFSHTFGMCAAAIIICLCVFFYSTNQFDQGVLNVLSRTEMMMPYFVSAPIYGILIKIFVAIQDTPLAGLSEFIGLFTVALSMFSIPVYVRLRDFVGGIVFRITFKPDLTEEEQSGE